MLILLISGQDIRSLSLGLVREGRLLEERTVFAPPERYLSEIVAALGDWNVRVEDFDAIAVVTGPGSFTSSRISTTIANALAFAKGIPVFGIENPERKELRELATTVGNAKFPAADQFAIPTYDRPPHIT